MSAAAAAGAQALAELANPNLLDEYNPDDRVSVHNLSTASAHGPDPPRSYAPTDELLQLALLADKSIGPLLVYAIAEARDQEELSRTYVKYLECKDPAVGDAHRMSPLASVWADPAILDKRTEFERLVRLLLAELAIVDELLDPSGADAAYGLPALLPVVRELLYLCASPPAAALAPPAPPRELAPPPAALDAHTMAAAIGSAMAAALPHSGTGGRAPAAPTGAKISMREVMVYLEAFAKRTGGEVTVTAEQVANRTICGLLRESLVTNGHWPVDKALTVDKMAALSDGLGFQNATDVDNMVLNPATGCYENAARDPVAADASTTAEYLQKLGLLLTTAAVLLHDVTCDAAPHLVTGKGGKPFLRYGPCLEFIAQARQMASWPPGQVRFIVTLALRDVATHVNSLGDDRLRAGDALKRATKGVKARMEAVVLSSFGGPQPGLSSLPGVSDPAGASAGALAAAPAAPAGQPGTAEILAAIKAAYSAHKPGKTGKTAAELAKAREKREQGKARSDARRAATVEHEGTKHKAMKGGNPAGPKCSNPRCFKGSWCASSHAHMT